MCTDDQDQALLLDSIRDLPHNTVILLGIALGLSARDLSDDEVSIHKEVVHKWLKADNKRTGKDFACGLLRVHEKNVVQAMKESKKLICPNLPLFIFYLSCQDSQAANILKVRNFMCWYIICRSAFT